MDEQKRLFAIRLNELIEKSGKTQTEIARDLGINKTTLSSWKRGVAFPTSGKLQMLADYFGVGKSYFVEEKPSFDYMLRINGRENILTEVEKMNDATFSHLLEYARFLNKRKEES